MISIVPELQSSLYKLLFTKLNNQIKEIYFVIHNDVKCPFILINMLNITNSILHNIHFYHIEFEICIFDRSQTQDTLIKISNDILESITINNLKIENHFIISIKDQVATWVRGQDLLTTKLAIKYNLKLREKI